MVKEQVIYSPAFRRSDVAYFRNSLREANSIAGLSSGEIIDHYGKKIRKRFEKRNGVPVIIPAYNEEKDLSRLLLGLANIYTLTRPVVINNGSDDKTADVADQLGVERINENFAGKLAAERTGLKYILTESPDTKVILNIEADCIPCTDWGSTILSNLDKLKTGGVVYGLYWHYGSTTVSDFLLSVYLLGKTPIYSLFYDKVSTHGGNSGLKLDREGKLAEALLNIDISNRLGIPDYRKAVLKKAGAEFMRNMSPRSLALTRSDRIPTVSALAKLIFYRNAYMSTRYPEWFR